MALVGPREDHGVRCIEQDDQLVQELDPRVDGSLGRELLGAAEQFRVERKFGVVGAAGVARLPAVDVREHVIVLVGTAGIGVNAERAVGAQHVARDRREACGTLPLGHAYTGASGIGVGRTSESAHGHRLSTSRFAIRSATSGWA